MVCELVDIFETSTVSVKHVIAKCCILVQESNNKAFMTKNNVLSEKNVLECEKFLLQKLLLWHSVLIESEP